VLKQPCEEGGASLTKSDYKSFFSHSLLSCWSVWDVRIFSWRYWVIWTYETDCLCAQ